MISKPTASETRPYLLGNPYRLSMLAIVVILSGAGCVSRRMTIVSNPPGAMTVLDGKEIGYTPASADFIWYGTRNVTLIKDGYETRSEMVTMAAPWYQWPIIEFFSDNFSPRRITDRRVFNFDLQPKQLVPDEDLRNRAKNLRNETRMGE